LGAVCARLLVLSFPRITPESYHCIQRGMTKAMSRRSLAGWVA
jgi:hypothetical protein